ncbi:SRPBCC family protein [Streptomyces hebeiensis]
MNRTDQAAPDALEPLARLRKEVTAYLTARARHAATTAGGRLTGLTGRLTDIAENGGHLPAIGSIGSIGSRLLHGESPVKALLSEKAKGLKENVVEKAKGLLGGGGSGGKAGSPKVTNIIEVLDVGMPLRTCYDYWTQYERFSGFTKGVRDVSKDSDDDTASTWKTKVGPSARSFRATVLEQVPDERIVWTSEGSRGTTRGAVSFHELAPALTRIVLVVEYYPSGFFEKTGNIWRAQGRRLRLDFKNFQRYVTLTDEEPGDAWRGEIRDGEVVRTHEEVVEEEEAAREERYEGDEDEDEDEDSGNGRGRRYEDEAGDDEYEEEYEDEVERGGRR